MHRQHDGHFGMISWVAELMDCWIAGLLYCWIAGLLDDWLIVWPWSLACTYLPDPVLVERLISVRDPTRSFFVKTERISWGVLCLSDRARTETARILCAEHLAMENSLSRNSQQSSSPPTGQFSTEPCSLRSPLFTPVQLCSNLFHYHKWGKWINK